VTDLSVPVGTAGTASASASEVFAVLVAASGVHSFGTAMWPHHEALWRIAERAQRRGGTDTVRKWTFVVTSHGQSLVGLAETLWNLCAEGWLREDQANARYVVTEEFSLHGRTRLAALDAQDRRFIQRVARSWSAWTSTTSKNRQ
jgi:hypothetical protein